MRWLGFHIKFHHNQTTWLAQWGHYQEGELWIVVLTRQWDLFDQKIKLIIELFIKSSNLNDLITFYSDLSENSVLREDQASDFFKNQIEAQRDDMQWLCKSNGYP